MNKKEIKTRDDNSKFEEELRNYYECWTRNLNTMYGNAVDWATS